ncbi:MAG TPA: hypothetical protein PLR99_26470 [Polyangiaceae bacterium]|nr:hypothetical protein [Polyangiaceae bacterium]
MRGALALAMTACFIGCGLSLAPSGPGAGVADASADGPVPPPTDAPTPPVDAEPEKPLAFAKEAPVTGTVVAMAQDDALGIIALLDETTVTGLYSAYVVGGAAQFSFSSAGQPTSFAPYSEAVGPTTSRARALFTLGGGGLLLALEDTTSAVFGDNAGVVRVVRTGGEVYAGTLSAGGGTRILLCPLGGDAGSYRCESGRPIYDSVALGGFVLSKSRLRLAGLTGSGDSLRLVASRRASFDAAFITPGPVPIAPDALGAAEELVSIADDGSSVTLRGKCHTSAEPTCLITLSR